MAIKPTQRRPPYYRWLLLVKIRTSPKSKLEGHGSPFTLCLEVESISGWWCNNHLEKYDFVNGKDDIPYMKWKIIQMFETTNQISLYIIYTTSNFSMYLHKPNDTN